MGHIKWANNQAHMVFSPFDKLVTHGKFWNIILMLMSEMFGGDV
jgi:hypothetical protein